MKENQEDQMTIFMKPIQVNLDKISKQNNERFEQFTKEILTSPNISSNNFMSNFKFNSTTNMPNYKMNSTDSNPHNLKLSPKSPSDNKESANMENR